MVRMRKGALLSLQTVLAFLIFIVFVGAITLSGFNPVLDGWRLSICQMQATALDNKLAEYAKGHRSYKYVNYSGVSYADEGYDNHFSQRGDYPLTITQDGKISSSTGNMIVTGFSGYIGWNFGFTTTAKKEPFKFVYIPLDENGKEVNSTSMATSVVYYKLIYYDRKGGTYASPRSYKK